MGCGCGKNKSNIKASRATSSRLIRSGTNQNKVKNLKSITSTGKTAVDKDKVKIQKLRRQAIFRALGH